MRKFLLGFLFLAAAAVAPGQVRWGFTNVTIDGSFFNRVNAPGTDWFRVNGSGDNSNVSETSEADFYGTDTSGSHLEAYADFADDGDTGPFGTNGGNLQIGFVNNTGSTIFVASGTFQFHFDIPATTSGFVTGYTVTADDNSIANDFSFSFDGFGGMNVTQIGSFSVPGGGGLAAFSVNLTTPTAVPEPAGTGLAFACAGLAAAFACRRRR